MFAKMKDKVLENMKKSSFVFKRNDIKGSGVHVYFLLFDFAIFGFIVSFDGNRFSQTFFTRHQMLKFTTVRY